MALKNKNFTKKLVLFFLILTTIGLLSGCAFPPADDVPGDYVVNDPVVDNPIIDDLVIEDPVDEPTQPTNPGEIDDPKDPELKDPNPIDKDPEDPIDTKPIEPALEFKRAFYVSNSGDDSKNGLTPETAWRTIARVNKQVLEPGDAVLFKRGDTWVNENLAIRHSGTAENRITYSAYGEGDRPVITGIHEVRGWRDASNWNNLGNNAWSIRLGGSNGRRFWLNDLEVERSRADVLGAGGVSKDYPWQFWDGVLYVYSEGNPNNYYTSMKITSSAIFLSDPKSVHFITMNNLDIRGWRYTWLSGCSHWIIEHCNWGWGNPEYGIRVRGDGNQISESSIIRYCTFDSGDRFSDTQNPSIFMYNLNSHSAITLSGNVKNWQIHNNEFVAWGHTSVGVGSTDGISEGNKIYNNYFSHEWNSYGRALGARGIRLEDFNENNPNEIFNNYIYEQRVRSQFQQPYLRVYNNIFDTTRGTLSNRKGELRLESVGQSLNIEGFSDGNPYKMKFYNNIFAYAIGEGVSFDMVDRYTHSAEGTEFVNNIFYNNQRRHLFAGTSSTKIKDTLFKNNLFFANQNDFLRVYNKNLNVKDFNALITNDLINNPQNWITSGNLNVDPMFVDPENGDFRLRAGSPAIGAGINVGLTHDYDGNLYKSNPSIGPFEFYP
jgi:hypothetical protein